MKDARFLFKGYEEDLGKGEILFHFALDSEEKAIDFTEKISFPPIASEIPPILLKSILNNLMLILGISYWKTYCPKEVIIEGNFLTKEQANFWNIVYTKGLGEFFYKNKIDFRGRVKFPSAKQNSEKITSFQGKERALLGLGGGKDSIVAAELLKAQKKDFDLFMVGTSQIQENVAEVIGKKPIVIKRELDPKLFELNKEKGSLPGGRQVYNGHIPISVIYAFLGLFGAILYDYRSVVFGNEKSANYGNVEYLGGIVNHQWSKSEEFEKLFKEYVKKFITLDVSYSSLFRNMNELEVTREFARHSKYFSVFSSCNANFKISPSTTSTTLSTSSLRTNPQRIWCGKCAKCLFVFTILSAFLSKKEVLDIFGKNLFEDKALLKTFKELLGLENFKPFECVGTPEEMRLSLEKVFEKGEFSKTPLMEFFTNNEIRRA